MSNNYYNHTDGVPASNSRGVSATIRNEFDLIASGFDIAQNYYVDTGTANLIAITPVSTIASLTDGLVFKIKVKATVTGATTINLGATLGTKDLRNADGTALSNQIIAGQYIFAIYALAAGYFQLITSGLPAASNGLPLTGGTMTGPINEAAGASIAAAANINLTTATGNFIHITGSGGPVTSITIPVGAERTLIIDSTPTFTNSASLLLPGAANIIAQAGDRIIVRGDTAGANVISWNRANGSPISPITGSTYYQYIMAFGL